MKRDLGRLMRAFWEAKAGENATWYISSYRDYDDQDEDEFWRWGGILTARFLDESGIPFTGRERVLEIGCGIGRMTKALAARFDQVVGLDISEAMVTRARAALADVPNVRLGVGTGVDLSGLEDDTFDFVFSYIVFQHIPDPGITRHYIHEAARVLKPGGWFHFQVNDLPEERPGVVARARALAGRIRRALVPARGPRGLHSPAWRGSRLRLDDALDACREAGFEVVRTRGQGTQYLWITARKK